jgi:hypothetical protein
LLRYYYSKAFRIRTTARRRTSSRRSTLCVSRRTLSNSWTRCPASTTTVRTDLPALFTLRQYSCAHCPPSLPVTRRLLGGRSARLSRKQHVHSHRY